MILGRDFLGQLAKSAELPSPQLGDAPITVPAMLMPIITLSGPVHRRIDILSPFPEDSFTRDTVFSQMVGAGNTQSVIANFRKGVWRIRLSVQFWLDVLGVGGQQIYLNLNQAASGAPGTNIGTFEGQDIRQANVVQNFLFQETLMMEEDFQLAVQMFSIAGSTVNQTTSLLAQRLA